ncbi:MAG: hypothetical protein ABI721_02645 [Candidatus Dojkabacteria bacterium]
MSNLQLGILNDDPLRLTLFNQLTAIFNEGSIDIEIQDFSQYIYFLAEDVLLKYIKDFNNLPRIKGNPVHIEAMELWLSAWSKSGFQDEVIMDMIERVFKYYPELNNHLAWKYLILEHFVKRLDIKNEFRLIRDEVKELIENTLSTEMIRIIELLSDIINEMRGRAFCLNENNKDVAEYYTNVDHLFNSSTYNITEFYQRMSFLENSSKGMMLRRFHFIKHFKDSKPTSVNRDICLLVADAFLDVMNSTEYREFTEDPKKFGENLYQEYLQSKSEQ